ncbi:HAD family hydrolase [Evansella halocellulosilytica]|uniref:HAD family hydrolase n=1 Tax=Evansella halocellulosilytica TaxID=2011013 RepID=UPI0015C9AA10|nr:HAD family hydrolase [Evansella halocellulosilytica]
MKWEGICFDLDNTLFSHEKAFKHAIKASFEHYLSNVVKMKEDPISFNDFFNVFKSNSDRYWSMYESKELTGRDYRRLRFMKTMEAFKLPSSHEHADLFHEYYYNIVDDFSEPYPGMEQLLSFLKNRNIQLGIITNGMVDTQYGKVKKIGAGKWIPENNIIVSEEVGVVKPSTEIFRIAEKRMKLRPDQLLFIGDSWKHDVEGAKQAGWEAIFLNSRNEERNSAVEPFIECQSLIDVYNELLV